MLAQNLALFRRCLRRQCLEHLVCILAVRVLKQARFQIGHCRMLILKRKRFEFLTTRMHLIGSTGQQKGSRLGGKRQPVQTQLNQDPIQQKAFSDELRFQLFGCVFFGGHRFTFSTIQLTTGQAKKAAMGPKTNMTSSSGLMKTNTMANAGQARLSSPSGSRRPLADKDQRADHPRQFDRVSNPVFASATREK